MEISIMTPTITKSLHLGFLPGMTPHVGISMVDISLGMLSLPVIALGLAVYQKLNPESEVIDNVCTSFTAMLPFIAFAVLGWFFWKLTGMFAPLTLW